jgi:putative addiction module component (TIGR02574 family)
MTTKTLLDSALKLPPSQRFELIEELVYSLDRPDPELDRIWLDEAQRRLAAHRSGQATGIPEGDVLGQE